MKFFEINFFKNVLLITPLACADWGDWAKIEIETFL